MVPVHFFIQFAHGKQIRGTKFKEPSSVREEQLRSPLGNQFPKHPIPLAEMMILLFFLHTMHVL